MFLKGKRRKNWKINILPNRCVYFSPLFDLWDVVLTDTDGKTAKFTGSMVGGYEVDGINLSTLAREILPIDDL